MEALIKFGEKLVAAIHGHGVLNQIVRPDGKEIDFISQIIRYCVTYAHDLPLLRDRLNEIGVPILFLDVEYGTSGSGQIQTRVQAFLEMLEGRKR